jgi:hypothetical protein
MCRRIFSFKREWINVMEKEIYVAKMSTKVSFYSDGNEACSDAGLTPV